jgi:chemotaxis protein methyltransferase CheR
MSALNNNDFEYVKTLVLKRAAIVLETGKEYLVESRLTPLARQEGFASLEALLTQLRAQPFNVLHWKVVEAMTTNETSFFRDAHPFEALKKVVVPELLAKRTSERTLNLWCAASSSGQEPYTVSMLLRETFPALATWTLRFLASDISLEMLERAREGCYSQLEVNRGLPAALLVKYFQKKGAQWQIKEDLRRAVEFQQVNLAEAWPTMPPMDIVFMRNVMIYFNIETKKTILGKLRKLLRPDGYLFLGGAETTLNLDDAFERVEFDKSGCYRLRAR